DGVGAEAELARGLARDAHYRGRRWIRLWLPHGVAPEGVRRLPGSLADRVGLPDVCCARARARSAASGLGVRACAGRDSGCGVCGDLDRGKGALPLPRTADTFQLTR